MDATPWAAIITAIIGGTAIVLAAIFKLLPRKNGGGGTAPAAGPSSAPGVFVLEKVCDEKHDGLNRTITRLEDAGERFIAKLDDSTMLLHSRIDEMRHEAQRTEAPRTP